MSLSCVQQQQPAAVLSKTNKKKVIKSYCTPGTKQLTERQQLTVEQSESLASYSTRYFPQELVEIKPELGRAMNIKGGVSRILLKK